MIQSADSIRVFIALEISTEARQALAQTVRRLRAEIPHGVRWVDPTGIHLTLKFLGNIDAHLVDAIYDAMRDSAQGSALLQIRLSGLGLFPSVKRPRVLWAGVDGDLDSLAALQEKVEQAATKLGFLAEARPFNPHLTLGRVQDGVPSNVRGRVSAVLTATSLEPSDPWQVDGVHLIRSTLTPDGAVYTSLGSVPLVGT